MKSRTIVNTSIVISSAAIITIFASWFSPLLFNTSLNSPVYYGVVIVLAVASIVFGILQVMPGLLALLHAKSEQDTSPILTESDTDSEQQSFSDLVSDIEQKVFPDLVSVLNRHSDRQQETMSILDKNINQTLKEIAQQNHLMLKESEVRDQQLNYLTQELKNITQQNYQLLKERDLRNQQQSYPIRVTMEINGVPVTIETPDADKADDIVNLVTQRIQATASLMAERRRSQSSLFKESEETYKVEDNSE